MKAEEIRQLCIRNGFGPSLTTGFLGGDGGQAFVLFEIAAQLAELNEKLAEVLSLGVNVTNHY